MGENIDIEVKELKKRCESAFVLVVHGILMFALTRPIVAGRDVAQWGWVM
jgi:hypothetical protein